MCDFVFNSVVRMEGKFGIVFKVNVNLNVLNVKMGEK